MRNKRIHLLRKLSLPDRFESLYEEVGPEVAKLLVRPRSDTIADLETASLSINARGEGLFVPLYGKSGRGKTTLARNINTFLPSSYSPTVDYKGQVSYERLNKAVEEARDKLATNDERIVPLNLDHRESDPPSPQELAEVKRFLRSPSKGARAIVFWPETDEQTAKETAGNFAGVAGKSAIDLPLYVEGPRRETWRDIARNTLEIANDVQASEQLGVDPQDYNPQEFDTIGDFIREISHDFTNLLFELISETRKPLSVVVVFVSASHTAGVLSQLTNSTHYGLADGKALLDATSNSSVGKWWKRRRGLLTRTIYQLDAHILCLPPAASISVLRTYGDEQVQSVLRDVGVSSAGKSKVVRDLRRTDFGKYLMGEDISAFEARGKPPETSTPAFEILAEEGFTYGKDKNLNESVADGIRAFYNDTDMPYERIEAESKLGFCNVIPDNSIESVEGVTCVEYSWRSGDYLVDRHRAESARYVLTKLRSYARSLNWTAD